LSVEKGRKKTESKQKKKGSTGKGKKLLKGKTEITPKGRPRRAQSRPESLIEIGMGRGDKHNGT